MANVDQRGFDNQPSEWVGAEEAIRLLGVKRETLYAYASRGLVSSTPGEGRSRAKRYLRADLERLRARHDARAGHAAVAAGALRWGDPVLETRISEITSAGPRYAGHLSVELARQDTPFEAVAELLWSGQLPAGPVRWPAVDAGAPVALLRSLIPQGTPPAAALMALNAAVAVRDLDRFGAAPAQELVRARALIRRLVAAVALARDPRCLQPTLKAATVAEALALALGAPTSRAALAMLDRALVLSADHELNASTFSARVAASSGADLYACVGARLATYSGPKHGGAVDRVEAVVAEIGRPERAAAVLRERQRRGEAIDGFGHTLYREQGDPRSPPLLEAAQAHAPRSVGVRTVLALVRAMGERGQHPTVDLAMVALGHALGLAPGLAISIFAIGRSAGWVAHILEQRTQHFLVRPRARYVGP